MVDRIKTTIYQFFALMLYLAHNNRGKNVTDVEQPTKSITGGYYARGFALPTILISSIVMLIVLLVSVSSTTAVRTAMKNQYYAQLAQVAGEAGITYAEACLNASPGGVPTWSNAQPLQSNTDCSGVETVDCSAAPLDDLCSVTRNGNVRSNFSIGMPPVDANGKAKTLPNTGFVEILRTSNGAVWRRYEQKSVPTTAVPDLCSGKATSALGWNNAVVAGTGNPFPEASAQQIKNISGTPYAGPMYFRKDFSVTQAGVYVLNNMGDDDSEVSVDGRLVSTAATWPAVDTKTVNLAIGCHTVVAKLTNEGILPNPAGLSFSLGLSGASSPLIVSDTSWRVSSGNLFHYSSSNYEAETGGWSPARAIQLWSAITPVWTAVPSPAWNTTTGDTTAYRISTTHSYTAPGTYPTSSTTVFRNTDNIVVTTPMQVKLGYVCDDSCTIWLDGTQVATDSDGPYVTNTTTVTLAEGPHQFGVSLANGTGPSGFLFAAVDTSTGTVLTSSDATWQAAVAWYATDPNPYSYDRLFTPNPPIERGVNIAPDFSLWTLSGGASYNVATGVLTLPSTGSAKSPTVRVDAPTGIAAGGDFYATMASPYVSFAPNGGYLLGTSYYAPDGTTPAYNASLPTSYTANGCAQSIRLSVWTSNDSRCVFTGGPNVRYMSFVYSGSSGGYSSPDLTIKNPLLILSQ